MPAHRVLSSQELCCQNNGLFLRTTIDAIEEEGINTPLDDEDYRDDLKEVSHETLSEFNMKKQRAQCYSCLFRLKILKKKEIVSPHNISLKDIAMGFKNPYSMNDMHRLYIFLQDHISKILNRTITKDDALSLFDPIEKITKVLKNNVDHADLIDSENSVLGCINGERDDLITVGNIPSELTNMFENIFYIQGLCSSIGKVKDDKSHKDYITQLALNPTHHYSWFELSKHYRIISSFEKKSSRFLYTGRDEFNEEREKRKESFDKYMKCYNHSRLYESQFDRNEYHDYSLTLYFASKYIPEKGKEEDKPLRLKYLKESYSCFYKLSYPMTEYWFYPFMCGKTLEACYKLQDNVFDFETLEKITQHYKDASEISDELKIPLYKLHKIRLRTLKLSQQTSDINDHRRILHFVQKNNFKETSMDNDISKGYINAVNDIFMAFEHIKNIDPRMTPLCKYALSDVSFLLNNVELSRQIIEELISFQPKLNFKFKMEEISIDMITINRSNEFKRKILELYTNILIRCKDKVQLKYAAKCAKSGKLKNVELYKKAIECTIYLQTEESNEPLLDRLRLVWETYELATDIPKQQAKSLLIKLYKDGVSQNLIIDDISNPDEWLRMTQYCKKTFSRKM